MGFKIYNCALPLLLNITLWTTLESKSGYICMRHGFNFKCGCNCYIWDFHRGATFAEISLNFLWDQESDNCQNFSQFHLRSGVWQLPKFLPISFEIMSPTMSKFLPISFEIRSPTIAKISPNFFWDHHQRPNLEVVFVSRIHHKVLPTMTWQCYNQWYTILVPIHNNQTFDSFLNISWYYPSESLLKY